MPTATKTLSEMQAEVYEVNKALGWYDKQVSFPEAMALVHSEISEALEAYRKHGLDAWIASASSPGGAWLVAKVPSITRYGEAKPEGVPSELADILIRLLDYVQRFGYDLEGAIASYPRHGRPHPDDDFGASICILHDLASRAYGRWDIGRVPDVQLAAIYEFIVAWSAKLDIDLMAEYEAKLSYNRTREYRHGGKRM